MLREYVTDRRGNHLHVEVWVARLHVCIQISKLICRKYFPKICIQISNQIVCYREGGNHLHAEVWVARLRDRLLAYHQTPSLQYRVTEYQKILTSSTE